MVCDETYNSNAKCFQALIRYIPIPSTKHDIKIQIHGFTLNKHPKQILFTESYLTFDLHNAFRDERLLGEKSVHRMHHV